MSWLPQVRRDITQEETSFDAANSEAMFSRVGSSINFINHRHVYGHDFNINGEYNTAPIPFYVGDGFITYPFTFEIMDVIIMSGKAVGTFGAAGFTQFDILWRPETGGTFQSIFSLLPSFSTLSPTQRMARSSSPGTWPAFMSGGTLQKTVFNPYDNLVVQLTSAVPGPCSDAFLKLFIRPVSDV